MAGGLPPYENNHILRLCDCASLLVPPTARKSSVAEASRHLSSVNNDSTRMQSWSTQKSEALADVARAAISWIENDGLGEAKSSNAIFEFLSVHQPDCLENVIPSVVKVDHIYTLAAHFQSHESGQVLLQAIRHASANVNTELLFISITDRVREFPGITLRILDALEYNTQAALEAALTVYRGSLSSVDRTALRILTRCGLPRDAPNVRAWATAISGTAANVDQYVDGEWIFDFLKPDRIAASVVRFPLRRAVRNGYDDMEDDDPTLDIPDDEGNSDDTEMDEGEDEDEDSLPDDGEWDRDIFQVEGDDRYEEHSDANSDDTDASDQDDDCGACDDYEAEDGMSDAEDDEDCEATWREKCYDPRLVLPALYHALAESGYEDDDARIARRAYESGGIAYAAAALSSKHSQTRALAVAVLGRFSAKLASSASSMDRGFVARPFVRTMLESTFAALKEASDPLRGPRRLPCLWSSIIARCFDALTSPRHPGFAVAAAHTVRRAIARPWHDAPLVRDAFINDAGLALFCDDDARDKVRGRFWAYECLVDGARDNGDAKSLRRAGGLSLAMTRMEELLSGGASIVQTEPNETRIMLTASGMAPPGAGSLLEQRNGKEDLRTLRKVNALARAEGDAAHRLLASVGRSRCGRRLLVTDGPVYYLADRVAASHEPRDIELVGAILSAACDDLDYFSEDRFPFLLGFFDLATDAVMSSFYDLLAEQAKDAKSNRIRNSILPSLDDEDFEDEFLAKPLSIIGDFGEVKARSAPDLNDTTCAALNFFLRRYLVTRQLTLSGVKRIGGYNDRQVHVEDAWSISRAAILVCFGEQPDLRTAAARLMRTVCSDASAARLAMTFGPPIVVFLGQQLWIGLKDKDPIGNRLFGPLLEFFVALLISRLSLQRTYHRNEDYKLLCHVSTRRQLAATINLSLRAARIGQGRPAVDMLAAARLEFGIGFGHAANEPFVPTPVCPLHRVDDLRRRLSLLAKHDRRGLRPGMATSFDVHLADALDAAAQDSHCSVPKDAAALLTHDDIINAPDPQPGDSTHQTALVRIEARSREICERATMTDLNSPFVSILLEHKRPQVDPKDLIVDVKVCDACLGKVLPQDLEYLDEEKQLWWRVDISPES